VSKQNSIWITSILLDLPWAGILGSGWKHFRKLVRGLSLEGIYEVLEYDSTLELMDKKGQIVRFQKRKKVRYLQDNVIAFQDLAWAYPWSFLRKILNKKSRSREIMIYLPT